MQAGTYIDEKIIHIQNICKNRTRPHELLSGDLTIRGRKVRFIPFNLFDGKAKVLAPENFIELPREVARLKYVSKYRPPVILTSPNYEEDFGFHLLKLEDVQREAGLEALILQMQAAVMMEAAETVIYDSGTVLTKGQQAMWFEYKNFTLDEETYNLQFLVEGALYLLVGTFNCRMRFFDEWKPPALESLEHIKLMGKGEERDEGRQSTYISF